MKGVAEHQRRPPRWTFAIVGLVVALVVFVGVGPPGAFLSRGTDCELGSPIGTYTIWAPTDLVNIPDGGTVTVESAVPANYTFTSGSLTVGALPPVPPGGGSGVVDRIPEAGIFAGYADWNFTFYRTTNLSQIGVNSDPCTQPYVASFSTAQGFCHSDFSIIPIPDNATDAAEPHVWNATTGSNSTSNPACPVRTPGTYVWFNSTLNPAGTGVAQPTQINICNGVPSLTLYLDAVAQLPVVVTAPYDGHSVSAVGFLTWGGNSFAPTATYTLPGGWVWTVGPVGPVPWAVEQAGSPIPGLLAFERSAC